MDINIKNTTLNAVTRLYSSPILGLWYTLAKYKNKVISLSKRDFFVTKPLKKFEQISKQILEITLLIKELVFQNQ